MKDLFSCKKNINSQFGEDGIIEEVFERLKHISDKNCCEFGAWNGKHFSNTYNLISTHNYNAVLIEGNTARFNELKITFPEENIVKINKFVDFRKKNEGGGDNLDQILSSVNFKKDFDFLSIDIDGCDYYVLESIVVYRPKLICVEFNRTIPNHIVFIQKKDISVRQGCSALAFVNLAKEKNYSLIASTDDNLFFIDNIYKNFFTKELSLGIDELVANNNKVYIFSGFDGTIFTSKEVFLPWHEMTIKKITVLPKILTKCPGYFNLFEKCIFYIYKLSNDPSKYLKSPKKYLGLLLKVILRKVLFFKR
jgi:hypothetical protein